jgi:hypothetical protein
MPDLPLYVIAYRLAGLPDLASLHTNGTVETHGVAVEVIVLSHLHHQLRELGGLAQALGEFNRVAQRQSFAVATDDLGGRPVLCLMLC